MNNLDDVLRKTAANEQIHTSDLPLTGSPEAEQAFKDSMAEGEQAAFATEQMVVPHQGGAPFVERIWARRLDADTVTLTSVQHPVGLVGGVRPGPGIPGQAVTLRRAILTDQAEALLLPHPRHPLNASLSTNPQDRAQAQLDAAVNHPELISPGQGSQFNGYKYRDPDDLQQGIENFLATPGVRNDPHHSVTDDPDNSVEKAQISHRLPGFAHLVGGRVVTGEPDEVTNPEEELSTGRTDAHNHPPESGSYRSFMPSMLDQRTARLNQHLRSFVKVPDFHKSHADNVLVYSGALPLRHYISLPNDGSHPVAPDSPDSYSPGRTHFVMPTFKHPDPDYEGEIRPPGPSDKNSLSGTERDDADLFDDSEES